MATKYKRHATDKKLGGVCGGFARMWNIDPLLVRIGWVALTILSVGVGIVAYVLLWWLADAE